MLKPRLVAFCKQSLKPVKVKKSHPISKDHTELGYVVTLLVNLDAKDTSIYKYFCSTVFCSPGKNGVGDISSWTDAKAYFLGEEDSVKRYMAVANNILEKHRIYAISTSITTNPGKVEKEVMRWRKNLA